MDQVELLISNCQIVTPYEVFLGWLGISNGKIISLGKGDNLPSSHEIIDGEGNCLLPGRVEPHIHLGVHYPYADHVEMTSAAALAGGTTLMCAYNRSKESYFDIYPEWEEITRNRSYVDMVLNLQIQNRQHINEIPIYREKFGTLCYKLHLDYRVKDIAELDIEPLDDGDAYLTLKKCAEINGIVAFHCEDVEIIRYTLPEIKKTGRNDLLAWSDSRPAFCEVSDLHTIAYLSEITGCQALVVHLSTADGIRATEKWNKNPPLLETLVQFLTVFPEEAGKRIGSIGKMNPPLRDRKNGDKLWAGIRNKKILMIGTDHIACSKEENDDLWSVTAGMPGIEVALPLLLSEGVNKGRITLQELVRVACQNPAQLFHIDDRKGSIGIGKDADLVLIDINEERTISPQSTYSKLKTPANGMIVKGWPKITIKGGKVVFREGKIIVKPGMGSVIRPY